MGFWIFMSLINLLIPLTMLGFGKYFSKSAPKEINGVFGYRTTMSMKNKDTWKFAHHYCGRLWVTLGWTMLVITAIAMLLVIEKNESVVGNVSMVLSGVQLVFLIGSIFPTEKALKRTFDKDGNRK